MKKNNDIKPCPFCGEKARLNYVLGSAFIKCVNNRCKIQPSTWSRVNEDKVSKLISIWNKRT